MSTDTAAREILVHGSHALAQGKTREASLEALLEVTAEQLGIESAVVVVPGASGGALAIVASVGLDDGATAGLSAALRDPAHPIARTLTDREATFDVLPTRPGGPALRGHLPLTVARNGAASAVGVLAVAYQEPMDSGQRSLVEAVADLAAVALDRDRPA